MSTRRRNLNSIGFDRHFNSGLWMDKYIEHIPKKGDGTEGDSHFKRNHVQNISTGQVPTVYEQFFQRWKNSIEKLGAKSLAEHTTKTHTATVSGRMAVGLGAESVIETSISLHRIYGVPFIPGSALKGLAACYARNYLGEDWNSGSQAYKTVFGDPDSAGYITFFDAMLIPGTGYKGQVIYPDVLTSHHQDYYTGKNTNPPADWDSPNPVPFLSVTGSYLIALAGPDQWVEATFDILKLAMKELGVGAKTSSGYGRMDLKLPEKAMRVRPCDVPQGQSPVTGTQVQPKALPLTDESKEKADKFIQWVQTLTKKNIVENLADRFPKFDQTSVRDEHKLLVCDVIWKRLANFGLIDQLERKNKPWFVTVKQKRSQP